MNRTTILKIAIVLAAVSAFHAAALVARVAVYPDVARRIPPGVTIGGVPVGGLTEQKALRLLRRHNKFQIPSEFKTSAAGQNFNLELDELSYREDIEEAVSRAAAVGRDKPFGKKLVERHRVYRRGMDVPVQAHWDSAAVRVLIELTASKIDRQPVNAVMDWDTKTWSRHKDGQALDRDASRKAIQRALALYDGKRVALPVRTLHAEITEDKFRKIDFNSPLATFQTKFSEGKINRTKNLRRVADLLTGHEIKPGDTFSYNDTVGERNRDNGFFLAPVIANGRFEDDWGGGACQPSSTLFNAALIAGMDEFDWMPHSQASAYVDPGRDAAVAYGQIDLKFRNPHENSVFVFATATQGVFTVSLYSEFKPGFKVELRSEWWGRFFPGEKVTVDKTLEPGKRVVVSKGASGMSAALYRKFTYNNGRVVEERMANKSGDVLRYRGAKRIVRAGPDPQ